MHGRTVGHHDPDPGAPLEPELDEEGRERTGALVVLHPRHAPRGGDVRIRVRPRDRPLLHEPGDGPVAPRSGLPVPRKASALGTIVRVTRGFG